jgi:hypothetical protein
MVVKRPEDSTPNAEHPTPNPRELVAAGLWLMGANYKP